MTSPSDIVLVVVVGTGATAFLDTWLWLRKCAGGQGANFDLVGRWVAHAARGRFVHAALAAERPVPAERIAGWLTHYAVGIALAALLAAIQGIEWARQPCLLPALLFGAGTVVLPLFVMQPAMGAGFAASRTPAPLANCLRSLVNHLVFGAGLYLSAALVERISR